MESLPFHLLFQFRPKVHSLIASFAIVLVATCAGCGGGGTFNNRSTGVITTVAGNGTTGFSGDNGPAANAQFATTQGLAVDLSGNIYIADTDNHVIRKVAASTGVITTVAGNGTLGSSGDNGPATSAQLWSPFTVTTDTSGNLYIGDSLGRIRRVTISTGVITTVVGSEFICTYIDNIPAITAQLCSPHGVATDSFGNLYIVDTNDQAIRKVTASTGVISTVAGGNGIQGYSGDNGPAIGAQFNFPWGMTIDISGNLYVADTNNHAIRKVAATTGVITTVAGNGHPGYSGDNGPANGAQLNFPLDVTVDAVGNLYIADAGNNVIRKVSASTAVITTIAGTGTPGYSGDNGPAARAELKIPSGVAMDAAGNLFIGDNGNHVIRKVAP